MDDIDVEVEKLATRGGVAFYPNADKLDFIVADEKNITEFPFGRLAYFKDSEGNELALVKNC